TAREELRELARRYDRDLIAERGADTEAQVLEVIRDILASQDETLSVKAIASWFSDRHGEEYDRKVTPRWIGSILRKKLRLKTERTREGFVIGSGEKGKLHRLFERYGVPVPAADPGGQAELDDPGAATAP